MQYPDLNIQANRDFNIRNINESKLWLQSDEKQVTFSIPEPQLEIDMLEIQNIQAGITREFVETT